MRRSSAIINLAVCASLVGLPASADIAPEDVLDPGPRSEAVRDASAWDRVQGEVIYLRPDAPFEPDQSVAIKLPDPPKDRDEERTQDRWITGLVYGAILVGIIALIVFQGGRIQVSFNRPGDTRRGGDATVEEGEDIASLPEAGFFDRIAAMADRREALILLTGRALERAALANDMTLARAQTARDVVRAVPRAWQHRDALNTLVRQAEIVHFGGRELSEATWQDCLSAARPLFGRVAS